MELSYSSTMGKQQLTTYNLIMSNPIVIWNNNAIPSLIMLFRNTLLSVILLFWVILWFWVGVDVVVLYKRINPSLNISFLGQNPSSVWNHI